MYKIIGSIDLALLKMASQGGQSDLSHLAESSNASSEHSWTSRVSVMEPLYIPSWCGGVLECDQDKKAES